MEPTECPDGTGLASDPAFPGAGRKETTAGKPAGPQTPSDASEDNLTTPVAQSRSHASAGSTRPTILLLSAYHGPSQAWLADQIMDALQEYNWQLLSLPPRYFAFRLRGAPLSWWEELQNPEIVRPAPDLVIATSSVDAAALRAASPALRDVPLLYYFHENQFAYPQGSSEDQRHRVDAQMVQIYSALSADRVLFNSRWNRRSFLGGARDLLKSLPEKLSPDIISSIDDKSRVLPVPVELPADMTEAAAAIGDDLLQGSYRHSPAGADTPRESSRGSTQLSPDSGSSSAGLPHFIWPHRWEYDKNPALLLEFCREMERHGEDFRLSLLGQRFRKVPADLREILGKFQRNLVRNRPFESRREYLDFLARAAGDGRSFVLSTALHEFQGLSMIEGALAGLTPMVPDALSYPEIFSVEYRYPADSMDTAGTAEAMYGLYGKLIKTIPGSQSSAERSPAGTRVLTQDFSPWALIPEYRKEIEGLIG